MSISRLFEIVYLLLERGRITAPELASRFEVSVRTIYRDVDALSAAGVPVYTLPGKNGGIFLHEGYALSKSLFTADEQERIIAALKGLDAMLPLGPSQAARPADALTKLSGLFQRRDPDWLQVDFFGWGQSPEDRLIFERLKEGIFSRRLVSFHYANTKGETARRRAAPLKLIFKGGGWYIQAFCLDKRDYRLFKLTRVRDLALMEQTFDRDELPPPPAPPPELKEPPGEAPSPVRLVVRIDRSLAFRALDEFREAEITPDSQGNLLVESPMIPGPWLYPYLLSYGDQCEVLAPPKAQQAMARLARSTAGLYQSRDVFPAGEAVDGQ